MARDRERDAEYGLPERESPYREFEPQDEPQQGDPDYEYDFDEDYEGNYDDDSYEDEEAPRFSVLDFLSTVQGKVLAAACALLLLILIGVVVWRFAFYSPDGDSNAPADGLPAQQTGGTLVFGPNGDGNAPSSDEDEPYGDQDNEPSNASLVFAPSDDPTASPENLIIAPAATQAPDMADEPGENAGADASAQPEEMEEPVNMPEATDTPLPIILTNTPTPSPTAVPPTPTPSPSPTPTPSPTPRVDIATGKTNREAVLRSNMSAKASVKKTIAKGEALTIHEARYDEQNKLWYAVTVNDIATDGWMRDYVVALDGKIDESLIIRPGAQQSADGENATASLAAGETAEPTAAPAGVIGTGKTNRDANVRRIMNGEVLVQLRKNRPVTILDVKQDKKGDTWYEVRTESGTRGYMRDYVITLDKGVTLPSMTPTPSPSPTPTQSPSPTPAAPGALTSPSAEGTAAPDQAQPEATLTPEEELLQREVIGHANTNREANVRETPSAKGKVVRQLPKKTELRILDKYEAEGHVWYEVVTTTGKTHGFVRDYVIDITQIDKQRPAKTYEP